MSIVAGFDPYRVITRPNPVARLEGGTNFMKRSISVLCGAAVAAAALLVTVPFASGAAGSVCDGPLAPGTYNHLVVPAGAVCIGEGNVTIKGGVDVGEGATFALSSEDTPDATSTISGGVHAKNAKNVQIHFATINGGVNIQGGAGPFGGPFGVTWNTIEDNHISGGVTIDGYNGFWMGFIRNTVNGGVHLNNNVLVDEDGNEYVTNTISGGLSCYGNSPAPQPGDSGGSPNNVTGGKKGQCAAV